MNMISPLRRFPMMFAALALVVSPLGCGSDTPETVADTPAVPSAVDGSAAMTSAPVMDGEKVDKEIHRTALDAKEAAADLKAEAKDAVEGAEHKAEKDAKTIEEEAKKSAEKALDDLLPTPK